MNETEKLLRDNERLREIIGSWRRLAQEKAPRRREIVREGYVSGLHYKVYVVTDVPSDLPIKEALKEIRHIFLPLVLPYTFSRMDYSGKYKAWLVEVVVPMFVDMHVEMKNKGEIQNGK